MDVQTYTEYEVTDSATNESFITRERYVALACYKATDMVYEKHITVHNPSLYTQTRLTITRPWNHNPEFDPESEEE